MHLLFIRHGHAMEREEWPLDDLTRPLTEKGKVQAETAFQNMIVFLPVPTLILSSEAVRAKDTAEILGQVCGTKPVITHHLNPGCGVKGMKRALTGQTSPVIALVGHEPDLSMYAAYHLGCPELRIPLKKGSIIYIQKQTLVASIPQKLLL